MNIEQMLIEAQKLHPNVPKEFIKKISEFGLSNLNLQELTPANTKKQCEDLLTILKEARKNEN